MRFFTSRTAVFTFFLFSANLSLSAQQTQPFLDAVKKRHLVTASDPQQALSFHSLVPGQTYALRVPGDAPDIAQCRPDVSVLTPNTQVLTYNPVSHLLKFIASAEVMAFQLNYPCTWDPAHPPTHYVSIVQVDEKIKEVAGMPDGVISVTQKDADYLIRKVLVGGNCFDISNVTYSGQPTQIGEFSNGATNVGFNSGVVMATGNITVALGPNNSNGQSAGFGFETPDSDLQALTTGELDDLADIEFDFTPTQTPLTFGYVFASEEYCEFVQTEFNDVFGFFISGPGIVGVQNLAVVPNTTIPISINTINHLDNPGYYIHNTGPGGDNCGTIPPATGVAVDEIEYDGFTRKMVAVANVIPCSTYHIKLKIADVGDGVWDSAVFLQGGSFDAGGEASIEWLVNGVPDVDTISEGCGTVSLQINRLGTDLSQALSVPFTITGTATTGADFAPILTTYEIPAGQNQITVPFNINNDMIPEGAETVILRLNNLCSCVNFQEILTILDYRPMMPIGDTTAICAAGVTTVGVNPNGGAAPYTYLWNTSGTGATISPFVAAPTNYTVTITDACGATSSGEARVNINQPPSAQLLGAVPQICPGQSADLNISFTGSGPFGITYTLDNVAQPPINNIASSPYTLVISQPGTYQITGVTDGAGCLGSALGQVVVPPSDLDLTGLATSVLCAGTATGAINTSVTGGQGPFTYAWLGPVIVAPVEDPNGLPAGVYTVTVTDASGCTDTQSVPVAAASSILTAVVSVQGANCFNPAGGDINLNVSGGTPGYTFSWSNAAVVEDPQSLPQGTYTVTISDANSCTKTASVTVPGDFVAPNAVTSPPNSITCSLPIVTLDGSGSSPGSNFSYNWVASPGNITFGSNTVNPTVDQVGTYILTVQNITNGCTASASSSVVSNNNPPSAAAGADATLTCAAATVTLDGTGSSTGGNFAYQWTASGGGNIVGNPNVINPIVSATGTYTLLVTNIQNGCTATDFAVVNANLTPPNAVVAPPGLITCTVSEVTLTGTGSTPAGISYQWITSNGFIVSGQTTPSAIVSEAGQYTLVVTSPINGCTSAQTVTVNQDFSAPIAVATASNTITCLANQATVSAMGSQMVSTDTFVWSTIDGNFVSGTNTLTPLVDLPGTYSIVITNPTSMCTSQASIVVVADNVPPVASVGTPATLTCGVTSATIGDPLASTDPNLSYSWTASPGNISANGNTAMPTVDQPGTYNLLVSNSLNGCTNTASVVVSQNITPPTVMVAPGGEINCTMPTIQLNGQGSNTGPTFSYQWTSASGTGIGAGDNTLTPTIIAPGTYTLVVTNTANGCTNSATTAVTIDSAVPTAIATVSGPQTLLTCGQQTLPLSASGSTTGPTISYVWGTVNGQIDSGQGTPQIVISDPGVYTLIVTNTTNNCSASTSITVQENVIPPVAEAGANTILNCTVPALQLNGSNSSTGPQFGYSWTTISGGNFVSATNIINPQVNESGIYQLVVTDVLNGCTASDQVEIIADDNDPVVAVAQPAELTCLLTLTNISSAGSSTGSNFTYQWTGPGLQSNPNSTNATANLPGNYTLVVTNTANGCTTEESVIVTQNIQPPLADAGPDTLLNCNRLQLNIGGTNNSVGPNFTYNWIDPGGIVSGWSTLNPLVAGGGTYIIIVTDNTNGCTASDPMDVVTDLEGPQANGGPSFQLTCTESTYTLQAVAPVGPNFTYQWTTNGGSFVSPTNILNPTVDGAGQYFLLVTNTTNGCTSSPTVQITQAADVPLALANPALNLTCTVDSLTLNGAGSNNGVGYSILWTASNGGNIVRDSTTLNPVIDEPGTYTITVQNLINLCQANSSVTVLEDLEPPQINAGAQQTITCAVQSLSLAGTNASPGAFTYNWVTPDGNIVSGGTTLSPLIDQIGYYELEATSLQNGCTNVVGVQVVADTVNPISAIAQPDTLTCSDLQITLNAGASSTVNADYVWTTAGGNIVNQANPLAISVDEPGPYTLLVTDTLNGCTSSVTVNVPQNVQDPVASAGGDGLITCAVTQYILNGAGSSTGNFFYQWTTTTGNILVGANSLTPTITAGGVYELLVVDNVNGCTDTDLVFVNADIQDPTVVIATPGVIGCTQLSVVLNGSGSTGGNNLSFDWTTTNGSIENGANTASATVNSAGQYTLTVLNNTNGCDASQTVQVTDNTVLPLAEAGPPSTLTCAVTQTTLQGSGSTGSVYAYTWTTQGGNIVSGANSASPVVNQPGTYTLLVSNTSTGCTQTDTVNIIEETNVPTDFEFDLEFPGCMDNDGSIAFGTVQGGFGPYLYSIDGGTTFVSTLDFNSVAPGPYSLVIQDANGCEFEQQLNVPTAPDPQVSLVPQINIELGDTLELDANLGLGYPVSLLESVTWTPLEGLSFASPSLADQLNPVAQPLTTTTYEVTIVSVDGCTASARVQIRVDNRPRIYIPNAISPWNVDGYNDELVIFADASQVQQVDLLQVYDRWGTMVFSDQNFQPNDRTHGWDGRYRDVQMDPAVFVYYAKVRLIDNRVLFFKGDVTVLR